MFGAFEQLWWSLFVYYVHIKAMSTGVEYPELIIDNTVKANLALLMRQVTSSSAIRALTLLRSYIRSVVSVVSQVLCGIFGT